ncbi:MAG: MerR family transcriptional regulator [Beijerinckiaceae bacterium]|jgi:DNA-binding transcriptional MerR regulator|nr:MerR family transcriptional regulator [Beijerinckiaceae bacterium]
MDKAPDAYRTISEVGDDLDIAQHVLRFWETRFPQIKPLKRGGGRRYYRPDDVELLKGIRHLLYREGYTIKGVQRILKEQGAKAVQAVGRAGSLVPGLAPASPEDAYDEVVPSPSAAYQPPAPSPVYEPVAPPVAVTAPVLRPVTATPVLLPFDAPSQPAIAARMDDGQVSFTRGGLGARPAFAPVEDRMEPAASPVVLEGNAARQALLEALGELESARAAIGRVLSTRDRLSGD